MLMVGVEIGGTFTDLILMSDSNIIATLKVPTTPKHPEIGVLAALKQLDRNLTNIDVLVHGSTIATNAVIEKNGFHLKYNDKTLLWRIDVYVK